MRPRFVLLAAAFVLAGCADSPEAPAPPTAEELSVAYSPPAEEEPAAEEPSPSDEDRQSRPAGAVARPITPARWEGETDELICVNVDGCPGFVINHQDAQSFSLDGRVWRVRVTVTWDALDEATRELEVRAGGAAVTGPSPLVLVIPNRSDQESRMQVRVCGVERDLVTHLPSQPFAGLAEFNV
jgi:hypothetical protein